MEPTECACGSQNFERILIERPGRGASRTGFVACAECRAVYYSPEKKDAAPVEWVDLKPPFVQGQP